MCYMAFALPSMGIKVDAYTWSYKLQPFLEAAVPGTFFGQ